MKILKLIGLFLVIVFFSCQGNESYYGQEVIQDTIPPIIRLIGYKVDTAYLYSEYKDPGAEIYDYKGGVRSCNDATLVTEVEKNINNRLPGTYLIQYKGYDSLGYPLAVATRTVIMMENSSTFLNGDYNVACTCTAIAQGSSQPSIAIGNYTVAITPSHIRNRINLSALEVGSEVIVPEVSLEGNTFNVWFWSPDLVQLSESANSGVIALDRNSFTLQTAARPYQPAVTYHCKNVFTKQMIIH
jgi:hypothetical protein